MAGRGDWVMPHNTKYAEGLIRQLHVLLVDDNPYIRTIVHALLIQIGVRHVTEAVDGISALEKIREKAPDVIFLDWEMPLLNGVELVRIVRSPGVFPTPDIPIVMLTGHNERWRILESIKIGVNEFLCKPVSAQALFDRLISIVLKPRGSVHLGRYYGPVPRILASDRPALESPDARRSHGLGRSYGAGTHSSPRARFEKKRPIAG
jgi:two-component system, chemotaxis family, chemotaxis protein CheY